jgi:hypothetical protein
MASGTVTITFLPLVIDLDANDDIIGERLAVDDIVGLATKEQIESAIKTMLQEGDFDTEVVDLVGNIAKIEVSEDAEIEGIQPDEEESK